VNADYHGGWTQIFCGKATELETSRPNEERKFYYSTCIWRHLSVISSASNSILDTRARYKFAFIYYLLGVISSELKKIFGIRKLESTPAIV